MTMSEQFWGLLIATAVYIFFAYKAHRELVAATTLLLNEMRRLMK